MYTYRRSSRVTFDLPRSERYTMYTVVIECSVHLLPFSPICPLMREHEFYIDSRRYFTACQWTNDIPGRMTHFFTYLLVQKGKVN